MPSSAVRVLELKLQIDTRQFDAGIQRVLQGLSQLRQAMQGMGNISVRLSSNMNQTSNSMNRATRSTHDLGNSFVHTGRKSKSFFESTQGGFRLFGQGGKITRTIAVVRNYLLLYSFALGGVVVALNKAVQASVEYTNAMVGLGAIARATGQDINAVQNAAKDLAAKGFMNVSESAMGLKNLLATGFGLEDAMKIMKGFADSAAFNRQASFQWGEAVVRATEGIRLGLSQVSDACLTFDTPVLTTEGIVNIGDIVNSDKEYEVISYDFDKKCLVNKKIINKFNNGEKPVYKVTLNSGNSFIGTGNHRFYKPSGERKELLDFTVGEEIALWHQQEEKELANSAEIISLETSTKEVAQNAEHLFVKLVENLLLSQNLNSSKQQDTVQEDAREKLASKSEAQESEKKNQNLARFAESYSIAHTAARESTVLTSVNQVRKEELLVEEEQSSSLLNVSGVKKSLKLQNDVQKLLNFVLYHADINGKDGACLEKEIRTILDTLIGELNFKGLLGIKIGEKKYSKETSINVENVDSLTDIFYTLITLNQFTYIQNLFMTLIMEKHSVSNVTKNDIQNFLCLDQNKILSNSKSIKTEKPILEKLEGTGITYLMLLLAYKHLLMKQESFQQSKQLETNIHQSLNQYMLNTAEYLQLLNKWDMNLNEKSEDLLLGDKIVSIEFVGYELTYNITVEDTHRYFIGNNSIFTLSSNSGITKNLSQILVEQGKSQQDVNRISSDASVRQALLNGLMKEFTLYAGNAELALNNYSGSVSILSTSFFNFRKELGDSLIPLFSEFVKRITLVIQEWTKWYKINKDVIALKLDQYFGQEIDYLIALIKWLGQATVSLVKFIGENKNLVFVIVLLGAFFKAWMPLYKLITLVIDFTLAIKGLVVMSKSLGFISALTVAFGPAAPIMVGLTAAVVALTAAFFLLRKEEIDTSKVELEQVAKRQRLLRIMQDHNETLTNLTRSELEYVRAKIKAGDSSTELARKEMYLTDSLRDLEAQTLDTLYAIEQLDLKQSQIKFNKIVREDIYPEGFWSGDMNEEQAKLVQLRLKLRTDVFEKIAAADRNTPSVVWENYLKTLNEDFRTLSTTGLQVYEELNDKEKESFIGMKQHYQVAIGFVAARIEKQRELTTQITEITDAQKAAIKRFDEAIRKLKQDTDELNKPRGVPREVEKAQNRIEDIMKLGKEAGKSAEELDKLKVVFDAYVMAVSTDVATKEYTQILKEMNQELSELEKRMKTAEEASKSLFAKSSERGGQSQDIMTNIRRTTGLRGAAYKVLGISPEDIGGKTRVNELAAEQKTELEQIRTNRDEQLKIYQELYLKKLGFTEIYNQKVLELNEQTGAAILQTEQFYAAKQKEEKQKQIDELSQSMQQIINMVSTQVQNVANAYWTERDEIKRARDTELNDLKLQYDQGVIQAQEYAARRNLIMRNADIEMSNVTKKAWKDVSTSVLNTVGQMLSQLVAEQAAAVAKTNMLKGLGMSLAGGLGVGLLLAAGTYAISKSFAETPTQNYQDIYPSGTTAEERKRYGSLASAPVQYITITPSVSFENVGGGQIFIGSGSVSEFSDEVSQVIKETINSAVANNEIMLDGLSPK